MANIVEPYIDKTGYQEQRSKNKYQVLDDGYEKVRQGFINNQGGQINTVNTEDQNDAIYKTNLGFSLIKIRPNLAKWAWANSNYRPDIYNNVSVMGLMMNEFNYALQSNWETMEYPSILNLGFISDFVAFGGGGELGAVFKSKKVWKRSGDLSITAEVRFVDVRGTGAPLKMIQYLLMMATSVGGVNTFTGLVDTLKGGLKTAVKLVQGNGGGDNDDNTQSSSSELNFDDSFK